MKKPKSYKEATKTNNFLKVGLVGLVTGWRFELVTASGGIYRHKAVTKLVVFFGFRLVCLVCLVYRLCVRLCWCGHLQPCDTAQQFRPSRSFTAKPETDKS